MANANPVDVDIIPYKRRRVANKSPYGDDYVYIFSETNRRKTTRASSTKTGSEDIVITRNYLPDDEKNKTKTNEPCNSSGNHTVYTKLRSPADKCSIVPESTSCKSCVPKSSNRVDIKTNADENLVCRIHLQVDDSLSIFQNNANSLEQDIPESLRNEQSLLTCHTASIFNPKEESQSSETLESGGDNATLSPSPVLERSLPNGQESSKDEILPRRKLNAASSKPVEKRAMSKMPRRKKNVSLAEEDIDNDLFAENTEYLLANYKDDVRHVYVCKFCKQWKSPWKINMYIHLRLHVVGELKCDHCDHHARSRTLLDEHVASKHTKSPLYVCSECAKGFYEKNALRSHERSAHGVNSDKYDCQHCGEFMRSSSVLKKHIQSVHDGAGLFRCDHCDLTFLYYKWYLLHCKKFGDHADTSTYKCSSCDACFKNQSALNMHTRRVHEAEKTQKCQYCSFKAFRSFEVKLHERTHRAIYPYQCDYCNFSAAKKYQVTSHQRTHTGEKPFKCDKCSFCSTWNLQLRKHKTVHDSPTAILCPHCDVVFPNRRKLEAHCRKVHRLNFQPGLLRSEIASDNTDLNIQSTGMSLGGAAGINHLQVTDTSLQDAAQLALLSDTLRNSDLAGDPAGSLGMTVNGVTSLFPFGHPQTESSILPANEASDEMIGTDLICRCDLCGANFINQQTLLEHASEVHKDSQLMIHMTI